MSAALKARLQRLYLDGANSYAALVAESGLSRFAFQSLVKVENWGERPRAAKVLKAKARPEGAAALATTTMRTRGLGTMWLSP